MIQLERTRLLDRGDKVRQQLANLIYQRPEFSRYVQTLHDELAAYLSRHTGPRPVAPFQVYSLDVWACLTTKFGSAGWTTKRRVFSAFLRHLRFTLMRKDGTAMLLTDGADGANRDFIKYRAQEASLGLCWLMEFGFVAWQLYIDTSSRTVAGVEHDPMTAALEEVRKRGAASAQLRAQHDEILFHLRNWANGVLRPCGFPARSARNRLLRDARVPAADPARDDREAAVV